MEGVVENVQKKSDKLLAMLDKTTEEEVTLIEYIDRIEKELVEKKSEVFDQDQPPVYSINYADPTNWKFKEPIIFFYQIEVVELQKYMNDYSGYFVFQLFLIVILIVVFSIIKKRILKAGFNNDTNYKRMLVKIFSRNISAAFIVGLFASALIFPNRPELFKDIVVTIPLLIITTTLINRRFYRYLYLFGVIINLAF